MSTPSLFPFSYTASVTLHFRPLKIKNPHFMGLTGDSSLNKCQTREAQIVFTLFVDKDGMPLGFEVYPGNTFEGHTLPDIVQKIKKKFQVNRFIMVADRGLFSNGNLKILRKSGVEFIVGMKLGVKDNYDFFRADDCREKDKYKILKSREKHFKKLQS